MRGLVRSDQAGFSLVEVIVAMGIFAIIATFMAGSLAGGLRGALTGKRREVATQEGNRLLEIARSLSYVDLGLVQTDPTIATDPSIQVQPPATGVRSYLVNGNWEPILWATNAVGHPFNPHTSTVDRGSTTLTRSVYVSGVDSNGDGAADAKRVTVRVSWRNAGGGGPVNQIRAQTLVTESGAVPLGAGGTLTGDAFATGGKLSVTSPLLGLGAPMHITLPSSDGASSFKAVSNTNCTSRSAIVKVDGMADLDGYSVSVTADDDPRTTTQSNPPAQSSNGVLTIPAGPLADLIGSSIGSPISCEADVNDLGHESGTGSSLSSLNAQTNVVALGGLLNWLLTLASVQTLPVTQSIDHELVADAREVAVAAGVEAGMVNVLKIPGVIPDGLVRVDALDYGARVRAAETTPSQAPVVDTPVLTVRVFDNGNQLATGPVCTSRSGSYCVITVDPADPAFVGRSVSVTHNFTHLIGLNVVNLVYTTHVSILPAAMSPAAGVTGPNGERRWSAEYTPVVTSASLDATVLGAPIIDADVELNLGTVKAQACSGATC